ncbi:MAG: polyprenyl synthetase [Mycobacterium sp.]|nr:polyprenyl synthetase [Mycobacterium sp.]
MASVAVLGGGVGGLSAAHELAKRGFEVTVYEAREEFGGKARSIDVPDTGRNPLPGEHGFRFFPGFYRHLDATMAEIPYQGRTVKDNLVPAKETMMAQAGGANELIAPMKFPSDVDDLTKMVEFMFELIATLGIPLHEFLFFFERILAYLTACDERRLAEFESQSWWEFTDGTNKSAAYRKFIAIGMTRTLVAARAEEMSARTGCAILNQLLQVGADIGGQPDRILNGPTTDVWIKPWVDYLRDELGVVLHRRHPVAGIQCDGESITGVTVEGPDGPTVIHADYYLAALPVERLQNLLTNDLRAADPQLAHIDCLTTRWMNGAMFYLDVPANLPNGHIIFIDAPWALTALAQQQFWTKGLLDNRGDGRVKDIISVDVSDWETPGVIYKKAANACTQEEIFDEVWKQMEDHFDHGEINEQNVIHKFLDPGIQFPNPSKATNAEPLLINTAGSWKNRPEAVTAIPNLVLAADFVRTNTDLATMEGANEAARRAVNGILAKEGSPHQPCRVFELKEPIILAPFRFADAVQWRLGCRGPKKSPVRVTESGELEGTDLAARGILTAVKLATR